MTSKHSSFRAERGLRLPLSLWVRCALFAVPLAGTLLAVFVGDPLPQDTAYHAFADQRSFLGVPNAMNVLTNISFLVVGTIGLRRCVLRPPPIAPRPWQVFFAGVALVAIGSAWYHLAPNNGSLVWDRLPMAIAFMALVVSLLAEHTSVHAERYLLWPAIAVGVGSVAWWAYTDDLRLYAWVQLAPMGTVTIAIALSWRSKVRRMYLVGAGVCYLFAKLAELRDPEVLQITAKLISGHSLKHLLAAVGISFLALMMGHRRARLVRDASAGFDKRMRPGEERRCRSRPVVFERRGAGGVPPQD